MIEAALNLQNEPNFSGLAAFEGQIRVGKPGPDMGRYRYPIISDDEIF